MRLPLKIWNKIWTQENRWALVLFLIIVLVIVLTADNTPLWIYQGF